jgi:hypothetical protein
MGVMASGPTHCNDRANTLILIEDTNWSSFGDFKTLQWESGEYDRIKDRDEGLSCSMCERP